MTWTDDTALVALFVLAVACVWLVLWREGRR